MAEIRAFRYLLGSLCACVAMLALGGCAGPKSPAPGRETAPPARVQTAPPQPAEVVTKPLVLDESIVVDLNPENRLQMGMEVEEEEHFPHLRNKRITLVTNNAALDTHGVHVIERLAANVQTSLADVVLVTEDGARSQAVSDVIAQFPKLRVHTLTTQDYRLTPAMFADNDMIVFDMALPGPRYALETLVLATALETAALNFKQFTVLDRPPVMGGDFVTGPPPQPVYFGKPQGFLPIGLVPGMTSGELAHLFNERFGMQAELFVVPMKNWKRGDGRGWVQEPLWDLTEKGRRNFEELQRSPLYRNGFVELRTALELSRASDWKRARVVTENRDEAVLVLEAQNVAPITLMERLSALEPSGVDVRMYTSGGDNATSEALAVVPSGQAEIDPVLLSFALRMAAVENPAEYKPEPGPSPYARDDIFEGFRGGLTPAQLTRSWLPMPQWQDFVKEREKVLLYKNGQ